MENQKIENNDNFNFKFEEGQLKVIAQRDIFEKDIVLPKFKFLVNSSTPLEIKLNADFKNNEVNYNIKYKDKYLELGQLFLDSYSHTPILFKENTNELLLPMHSIKELKFRNYGNIVQPKDTVILSFSSNRLKFDINKEFVIDKNIEKVFHTKNKIGIVIKNEFDLFILNNIHISYSNDSGTLDYSKMEEDPNKISLNYSVSGYSGKYEQSKNKALIFHKSAFKNIFVEKTALEHSIPEYTFESENIKDKRDTLIVQGINKKFTDKEFNNFKDKNKTYPFDLVNGSIYSSKLMQTRGGKIKISPLVLENLFYSDINKNKIFSNLEEKVIKLTFIILIMV